MARQLRLLTFRIVSETFAADIMAVRQVVKFAHSAAAAGSISLRGEEVPLIDLRSKFVLRQNDASEPQLVVILAAKSGLLGLRVDEALTLIDVGTDELRLPGAIEGGVRSDVLVATVEHGDKLLLVIDVDALPGDDERRPVQSSDEPAGVSDR